MCFFLPFLFGENRVLGVLSVGEFSNQVELYSELCMGLLCGAIYQYECESYSSQIFFPEKGNNEGRKSLRKNTTKNYRN